MKKYINDHMLLVAGCVCPLFVLIVGLLSFLSLKAEGFYYYTLVAVAIISVVGFIAADFFVKDKKARRKVYIPTSGELAVRAECERLKKELEAARAEKIIIENDRIETELENFKLMCEIKNNIK